MHKWAIKLALYCLEFAPRITIKAQALVDFIAECSYGDQPPPPNDGSRPLYIDGSSNNDGSRAGLIIVIPTQDNYKHALKFMFKASNNEAEYKAVIAGIKLWYSTGANLVKTYSDSQLVVIQLQNMERKHDSLP